MKMIGANADLALRVQGLKPWLPFFFSKNNELSSVVGHDPHAARRGNGKSASNTYYRT